MNKKPPELPNIEDATLRACLAPLMDAMQSSCDAAGQSLAPVPVAPTVRPRTPVGSNDNLRAVADGVGAIGRMPPGIPQTLAEWRSQSDDELAALRMAELFLAMPDGDLIAAAEEFPKQISGTMTSLARIKRRLATHYDLLTAALALLERASVRVAADPLAD